MAFFFPWKSIVLSSCHSALSAPDPVSLDLHRTASSQQAFFFFFFCSEMNHVPGRLDVQLLLFYSQVVVFFPVRWPWPFILLLDFFALVVLIYSQACFKLLLLCKNTPLHHPTKNLVLSLRFFCPGSLPALWTCLAQSSPPLHSHWTLSTSPPSPNPLASQGSSLSFSLPIRASPQPLSLFHQLPFARRSLTRFLQAGRWVSQAKDRRCSAAS